MSNGEKELPRRATREDHLNIAVFNGPIEPARDTGEPDDLLSSKFVDHQACRFYRDSHDVLLIRRQVDISDGTFL